jgi:drug/metabolite transporter (DMT)-like permease
LTQVGKIGSGSRAGDNIGLGITLSVVAIMVFGIQDAITKVLVQTYSPFQIVMLRYWAIAGLALFLAMRQGPVRAALKSGAPVLQVVRGLLLMLDIWAFAWANRTVPLAELQAITLIYPLLVTLVAIPLLGEKVGLFRMGAVSVGFLGALVILRPGGLPIDAGVLFALCSAAAYALYTVFTRLVSRKDSTATSMVYVGLVGLVLSTGFGVASWKPMDLTATLLMGSLMVTMCLSHGVMMKALSLAPASVLQPFNYLTLPWGITLSATVFGHLIDPISLAGAGVIVGAGLVVMARERHKAATPPTSAEVLPPRD